METLVVRLTEGSGAEGVRRTVRFGSEEIWWAIDGPSDALPAQLATHDLAAIALIFRAMREGRHLHVDGPVSLPLLEGLEEFVACLGLVAARLVQAHYGERERGGGAKPVTRAA